MPRPSARPTPKGRFAHEVRTSPDRLFSSGPLNTSAREEELPPPPQVERPARRLGAEEHRTFGCRPRERMQQLLKSGALTAGDLMSTPAVAVHQDAQLTEAARIMARKRVKRLPVVDGEGRLAGIVSRGDLLKVFLRSDEDIAEEIRHEIIGLLPGAAPSLRVDVEKGVATLRGELHDSSYMPVAARLIRSVEGVVDVEFDLE
ncbi:MAG: CBS domain-containing protein [Gaiellales bacterium]